MKKYRAIATKKVEKNSTKKIIKQKKYESYTFKFMAPNFSAALDAAEKIAKKGLSCFETLKVSEV